MDKNKIWIVLAVIIVILGVWFYFAPKTNAPETPFTTPNPRDLSTPAN